MNSEDYEIGFIDALTCVLEIANRKPKDLIKEIETLWCLAKEKRIDRIQKELGYIHS